MAVLVYAEHDNAALKAATLNAVTAAKQLGDVTVLVAGSGCGAVAEAAAKIDGVSKVLVADDAAYANEIAENVAPLMAGLADGFDYIVAAATTSGKNVMPRVAALLDVQQISEITYVAAAGENVRAFGHHMMHGGEFLGLLAGIPDLFGGYVRSTPSQTGEEKQQMVFQIFLPRLRKDHGGDSKFVIHTKVDSVETPAGG